MKFTFQLHNLNVWLTLTVLLILHALMRNVKTHALRCPAGFGPTARLKTTEQFACADRDSLATPMRSAKNVSSKWLFFTNLKTHSKVSNFSLLSLAIAGCKSDDECPTTEACYNRECLDPCTFEKCGLNAECSVRNHRATCKCRPGYKGNPYERCRQYECLSDPECADYLACRNEKCVDPCGDCSVNADCTARNHRAICECRIGYTGNPYGSVCNKSKLEIPNFHLWSPWINPFFFLLFLYSWITQGWMYNRQGLPQQTILPAGEMQRPLPGHIPMCQQCRLHSTQHTSSQDNVLHLHTRLHW